jgi:redox-sensitive bicupin YhaK (pirin superfamily)
VREPIARYRLFVMNTRAEITQAVSDYELGVIPADQIAARKYL